MAAYDDLPGRRADSSWLRDLAALSESRLADSEHGDLPRWRDALSELPALPADDRRFEVEGVALKDELDRAAPRLGPPSTRQADLARRLDAFHPWRKGPLKVGGVHIETEWRSDLKWNRLRAHVDFSDQDVLDVGCGNGYFGWRMLGAGARLVVGIDPTLLFVMQWRVCRKFAGPLPNYVLPLRLADLPQLPKDESGFDQVLSLGVIYHRRDPQRHLHRLCRFLRPGGTLLLESLVLPDNHPEAVLRPPGRYARMRNVWALPRPDRLLDWVAEAGLSKPQLLDVSRTTSEEQRTTAWMRFESLTEALDQTHGDRTVEGHPAPRRALVRATLPLG